MDKKEIAELENIISYSKEPVERLMALITLSGEIADTNFLRSWILANEAINEASRTNNKRLLGKAYMLSANSLWKMADYTWSRVQYQEAKDIYEELEEMMGVARAYCGIGIIYGELNDPESAQMAFEKAKEASKAAGNEVFAATCLGNLGLIYLNTENYEKALECFLEGLAVYETVAHMEQGKANMYGGLAGVKISQKKFQEGIDYLQKSLDINRQMNNKRGIAVGLRNMGEIHFRIGNFGGAVKFLNEALEFSEKISYNALMPDIHQVLARCYSALGDNEMERMHTVLYADAEKMKKLEQVKRQEELFAQKKQVELLKKASLQKSITPESEKKK